MATGASIHAVPCSAGRPKRRSQRCGTSSLYVRASADANTFATPSADRLVFPGVGAFGSAMDVLTRTGMADALREIPNIVLFCAATGLSILKIFLSPNSSGAKVPPCRKASKLAKRVIACFDVRSNDSGDLVVTKGPLGEEYAWYQCTVNGGRDSRPIGAYELAKAVEELGAGEILLNCIDCDGQGCGFDIDLVKMVSDAVTIPVIASSGAGTVEHFSEVFEKTNASAALAAGIFHCKEVPILSAKEHLVDAGVEVRV
ncbi:hypothetical protein ABZP36_006712 [Zizania latifolia]